MKEPNIYWMKTNSLSISCVMALERQIFLKGFLNTNVVITFYVYVMWGQTRFNETPPEPTHTVKSKGEKSVSP